MKRWKKILIGVVIGLVVLGVVKNTVVKAMVQSGATFVTGAPVKIGSLAVGVFRTRVVMKDFQMYNPKGFPKAVMVDIPLIRVEYDLGALFRGEVHLQEVTLYLKEVVLYKNKEGQLNVDALKVAQQKPKAEEKPAAKKAPPSKSMPMRMDEVNLSLGKVIVKDYSVEGPLQVLAYPIGVENKTFRNINSPDELVTLVLLQSMGPTALKSAGLYAAATVLGVAFLPAGVAGVLLGNDSATETFRANYDKAYEQAKNFLSQNGEVVKEDPEQGLLQAKVRGSDLTLTFAAVGERDVEITAKARKMMLPKAEVAAGVLYQLGELLER